MKASSSLNRVAPDIGWRPHISLDQRPLRIRTVSALVVALMLFFSVFRFIPELSWSLELAIIMSIAAAIFSYAGKRTQRLDRFSLYILITAFGLPLISAIAALDEFGQPMLYGILAQRGCLLALFPFAVGNWIASGRISLAELRSALLILAWLNLMICAPIFIFLDPNDYSDLYPLVIDGGGVFNEFNLPVFFVLVGGLYYLNAWFVSWKMKYAITAAPFIIYLVSGHGGRILTIGLGLAILAMTLMAGRRERVRKTLAASVMLVGILFIAVIFAPEKMETVITNYQDAFAAALGAYEVDEVSANVRITQADIAQPYIGRNPILGSGTVSHQWEGGFQRIFGYFHPSDLGILGILFIYGLFGLLFFGLQLFMFARLQLRLTHLQNEEGVRSVLVPLSASLLFVLFWSLLAGGFVLMPEQSLFLFSVIFYQMKKNAFEKALR